MKVMKMMVPNILLGFLCWNLYFVLVKGTNSSIEMYVPPSGIYWNAPWYPPIMVNASQVFESSFINGTVTVKQSSVYPFLGPELCFDNDFTTFCHTEAYYNGDGLYGGTTYTQISNGTQFFGEWLTLTMPTFFSVEAFALVTRHEYGTKRSPQSMVLLNSFDNGTSWDFVQLWQNLNSWADTDSKLFVLDAPHVGLQFRIVYLSVANTNASERDSINLGDVRFSGHLVVEPTSYPSASPVEHPTSRPTGQPILSPTGQPISIPTGKPSAQPASSPTGKPTLQPISSPTGSPTTKPFASPSGQPTSVPSSVPSGLPTHQPTAHPTGQPSKTPSRLPTSIPSIIPSAQPTAAPTEIPSACPSTTPTAKPSGYPTSTPSTAPTILPTTKPTPFPIFSIRNNPSMTPTAFLTPLPFRPTRDRIPLQTVEPTSSPSTIASSPPSTSSMVLTNLPTFVESSLSPSESPVSLPSSTSTLPPFEPPTLCPTANPSLSPTVSPTSMSESGSPVSLPSWIPSSYPTTFPTFPPSETIPSLLPTTTEFLSPSSNPSVAPLLASTSAPSVSRGRNSEFPTAAPTADPVISRPSSHPSQLATIRNNFPVPTIIRGDDADTPSTIPLFVSTSSPTICESPPKMLTAAFRDDGRVVEVVFDKNTNLGGYSSVVPCDLLFRFALCSTTAVCTWQDAATVWIRAESKDTCVLVNASLTLASSLVLRLASSADMNRCAAADITQVVTVQVPEKPVVPEVVVSGATEVSVCGSWTVHVLSSTGSGGRQWLSGKLWAELTSTSSNSTSVVASLNEFLQSSFDPSLPLSVPGMLMPVSSAWHIHARLCNVLTQCSEGTLQVSVSSSPIPQVSLAGSSNLTIDRSEELSLKAIVGRVSGCSAAAGALKYEWTVVGQSQLQSISVNPLRFLLPGYSFLSGTQYKVQFHASISATGQSAVAEVLVTVRAGRVVAIISGGQSRMMSTRESLVVDASSSYDEDSKGRAGVSAGLLFHWSCVATGRNSAHCQSLNMTTLNSGSQLMVSVRNNANDSDSLGEYAISLLVYDATGIRNASAIVSLVVVGAQQPRITRLVATPNVIRASDGIRVVGDVVVPANLSLTAEWGLLDLTTSTAVALNAVAQTAVTTSFPWAKSEVKATLFLSIPASALGISGDTFSMSLTCSSTMGLSTQSRVLVAVNHPPSSGVFAVSPLTGVALSTSFVIWCDSWTDMEDNLPLSYSFGYLIADAQVILFRSRSDAPMQSDVWLPAGRGPQNILTVVALVYDAVLSVTEAKRDISVMKSVSSSSLSDQVSKVLSLAVDGDSDSFLQSTTFLTSLINEANCSLAPNCTMLRRRECRLVSDTCGECLSADLVGDAGQANTACLLESEATSLMSNVEETQLKGCPGQCSQHGVCKFESAISGESVHICWAGSLHCVAVCKCETGYYGADCSLDSDAFSQRVAYRSVSLDNLLQLIALEDEGSSDSSSTLPTLLLESVRKSEELSLASSSKALDILSSIAGDACGALDESCMSTLNSLANALTIVHSNESSLSHQLLNVLDLLIDSGGSALLPGQASMKAVTNDVRISIWSPVDGLSADDQLMTVHIPLSSTEKVLNGTSPVLTVGADWRSSYLAFSQVRSSLNFSGISNYTNHARLTLPAATADGMTSTASTLRVHFPSSSNSTQSFVNQSTNSEHVLVCLDGKREYRTVLCNNGQSFTQWCNGTEMRFAVQCPSTTILPKTVMLSSTSQLGDCVFVNQSDGWDVFDCDVASLLSGSARRLNNASVVLSATTSVDFVAMLDSTVTNFVVTVQFASHLNSNVLEDSKITLSTLIGFAVIVVVFVTFTNWLDRNASTVNPMRKNAVKFDSSESKCDTAETILTTVHSMAEESLPFVFNDFSFAERTQLAMKEHHRWLGMFFSQSRFYSRSVRVLALAIDTIIVLFVQALTFGIGQADDGRCATLTTQLDCESHSSLLRASTSQCRWDPQANQCMFLEPGNQLLLQVYVAIIATILSVPLSVVCEFVLQTVIASPMTWEWRGKADVMKHRWFGSTGRVEVAQILPSPGERSAVAELESQLRILHSLQSEEGKARLEYSWGLDNTGHFMPLGDGSSTIYQRCASLLTKSHHKSVKDVVAVDVQSTFDQSTLFVDSIRSLKMPLSSVDTVILNLFQRELLEDMQDYCLQSQEEDIRSYPRPRHVLLHVLGWIFLLGLNGGMLFYLFLFGAMQNASHQRAWVQSFVMWLVMEVLLISTLLVLVSYVLLPMLLIGDRTGLRQRLKDSVKALVDKGEISNAKVTDRDLSHNDDTFNAAKYVYVSYQVAKHYSKLPVADLVLHFETCWPRHSYHAYLQHSSHRQSSIWSEERLTVIVNGVVSASVFLLTSFLKLPNQSQQGVLQVGLMMMLGGLIWIHQALFQLHPALVCVPGVLCFAVMILCYLNCGGHRLRTLPIESEDSTSTPDAVVIVGTTGVTALAAAPSDSAAMVGRQGRRDSLKMGVQLIQMAREQRSEAAAKTGHDSLSRPEQHVSCGLPVAVHEIRPMSPTHLPVEKSVTTSIIGDRNIEEYRRLNIIERGASSCSVGSDHSDTDSDDDESDSSDDSAYSSVSSIPLIDLD